MSEITIKLETYNKLHDDNKKLKDQNEKLEEQIAFLAEKLEHDGQKVICKTNTIVRQVVKKTPYSCWECVDEKETESFTLINFDDIKEAVRNAFEKEHGEELANAKKQCEVFEQNYKDKCDEVADAYIKLRELKERTLWQRIRNKF